MTGPVALVAGGHGFIGRHVCRALTRDGVTVVGVGHGRWGEADLSAWGVSRWVEADITLTSLADALGDNTAQCLIHCAGSGSVAHSYAAPLDDFRRTVSTTAALLEFARTTCAGKSRVVLTSSAAVYGDQGDVDLIEGSIRVPISPYGFHKLAAEELGESYARFFGGKVSIVRLFSVYGEGLRKQLLWDAANKFERNEPEFFGTGDEWRDWIHVEDAASLLCAAAFRSREPLEIFNGANAKATTSTVLNRLGAMLGSGHPPTFNAETHVGNPRRLTADDSSLRSRLDWTPTIGLEEGLARYADWFKRARFDET